MCTWMNEFRALGRRPRFPQHRRRILRDRRLNHIFVAIMRITIRKTLMVRLLVIHGGG
jgi:hypothetical protein